MIDKVFLFNPYTCNLTDGGPSGVIAQNLIGHDLQYVEVNPVVKQNFTFIDSLRKRLHPPPVPLFYHDWYIRCEKIYRSFNVSRYRAVFFHDVFTLSCCLHLIAPSQCVILQSHCPELPHQEVAGSSFATDELIAWVRKIESEAYARADYVVLPNEGAAEIYLPLLHDRLHIEYLTTGSKNISECGRVGLDSSCCNLLFIGRRNRIKGFDLVLEAFRQAHRLKPTLRLYLLGRGNSIVESGVTDIGYSDVPHLWMRSCDYVVNFNRQSYLDLSVLEALSVGAHIIMTATNGHRVFDVGSDGIIVASQVDVKSLVKILLSEELEQNCRDTPSLDNIGLYMNKYTDEIYRKNLDALSFRLLRDIR